MRGRILAVALIGCAFLVMLAGLIFVNLADPGDPTERVKLGMTRGEIEQLLGGPSNALYLKYDAWDTEYGQLVVRFDEQEIATGVLVNNSVRLKLLFQGQRTPWSDIVNWLDFRPTQPYRPEWIIAVSISTQEDIFGVQGVVSQSAK